MSFDVKSLAEKKSNESGHAESEWISVLESARTSLEAKNFDFQGLEYMALASPTPAAFTVVARLIYQHTMAYPNAEQISGAVLNFVNNSNFALSDWIESLSYFYDWLILNSRKIDFMAMLKYLECCAAAPDAKEQGQTLIAILKDMLEVWDYEAG